MLTLGKLPLESHRTGLVKSAEGSSIDIVIRLLHTALLLVAPALRVQTGAEMAATSGSVSIGELALAAALETIDG